MRARTKNLTWETRLTLPYLRANELPHPHPTFHLAREKLSTQSQHVASSNSLGQLKLTKKRASYNSVRKFN
jgi:hypothetical protein